MTRDAAEPVAIAALQFIASDPDLLERFLALTGYSSVSIRDAAAMPDFLAGVLQHIVDSEPVLMEFAGRR